MSEPEDDQELGELINNALRQAGEPEITEDEVRRQRRHQVFAWRVFGVLFVASWPLGIYGDPDSLLTLAAWLGCACGMLLALIRAGVFHSMFGK